jgi:hypothetical protein
MDTWQLIPAKAFSEYAEEWDKLNERLYQSHPMLDSRFVGALIKYFGKPQTLIALYPKNAKQKCNFILLQPRKLGLWETFLPGQAQISPLLCSTPEALPKLFKTLSSFAWSLDLLCLDPLFTFELNFSKKFNRLQHSTTINIDISGSFDNYWKTRSKNLRKNITRYFNRLSKENIPFDFKAYSNKQEITKALHRYGELESNGWKGSEGTAIHSTNIQGQFYAEVLTQFALNQQAEITELYFNDQLVASRMIIHNDQMLIILKTTFDESYSSYAPGRLLLYLVIEREFKFKRTKFIEFYTNANEDQIAWSTGQRQIEHITIYKSDFSQKLNKALRKIKSIVSN